METTRTEAQQKAYERWLASNQDSPDKEWARFYNGLLEKYKHLPTKQKRNAIQNAIKVRKLKGVKLPYAHVVSGGIPSLGKKK